MKKERLIFITVITILSIILILSNRSCNRYKNSYKLSDYNLSVMNDSVKVYKTKNGEIEASRSVLITEKNKLSLLNDDLNNELKLLSGKIYELNKTIIEIRGRKDTVYINTVLIAYPDSSYGLTWVYDTVYNENSWRKIKGESKFSIHDGEIKSNGTYIYEDKIRFKLLTGLRENNGKVEIFAKSDYPGFDVINMDGAFIDPDTHPVFAKYKKKKRFSVGPYMGVGVGSNLKPSIQLGIGATYSLISF